MAYKLQDLSYRARNLADLISEQQRGLQELLGGR